MTLYSVDIAVDSPVFTGNEHTDLTTLKIDTEILKINKNKIINRKIAVSITTPAGTRRSNWISVS